MEPTETARAHQDAKAFVEERYGPLADAYDPDWWFAKLGVVVDAFTWRDAYTLRLTEDVCD